MEYWIARDKDKELNLYEEKPIRLNAVFSGGSNSRFIGTLPTSLFPEITWENSPQLVELKLK